MALTVHRSNRLETLGAELAGVVRAPLPRVLERETIVVQSPGMRRWLSFELAAQLGVAMNIHFPYFQEFAQGLMRREGGGDAFAREVLPWRIYGLLPRLLTGELQRYAGAGVQAEQKRFQLARQIAGVFDQYLVQSPERMLRWQKGEGNDWQARLWRELVRGHEEEHLPALLHAFLAGKITPELPARVSVFGLSSAPLLYLHLFAELGRRTEVHLFLLEPTDRYWGDFVSAKKQRRLPQDEHYEAGNELLASLGQAGQAFTRDVVDLEPHAHVEDFHEPPADSLLHALQGDILRAEEPTEPVALPADDYSVQVHCAHGPRRELQILHDRLLDLFERLPGLLPKDILVTMPDVETYAPLIPAVFGARLPYSIADRSARAENSVVRALAQLLALRGGRFEASAVLCLLENAPVRARFEITESDLDRLRTWVDEAGICWGIDGAQREELGLPPFAHNSWRAGLDRLLLGYALPGDGATLHGDVLPLGDFEGEQAMLLGRFADFVEKLFLHLPPLDEARPLHAWESAFRLLAETFLGNSDDFADEWQRLRRALRSLGELEEHHAGPIPFEVLQMHLESLFAETDAGFGFLAGNVTFCSLKPMRSVPFRVLCVLGLQDDAFPRHEPILSFNLLAREGRGRSRRADDRQLFLESLLSARDALLLSYSGLSSRDNSESPPSVAVTELLDYVARHYRDTLQITRHPLQSFSPRYFAGNELFSFASDACLASRAAAGPRTVERPLFSAPLGAVEIPRELDLRDLLDFFKAPAKFFLRERLRLRWPEREDAVDDCEPLTICHLDQWKLQQRLLAADTVDEDHAFRLARAEGILPGGWFGRKEMEEIVKGVQGVHRAAHTLRHEPPLPAERREVTLSDWRLTGTLTDIYPGGLVRLVPWEMKARDRLLAWIEHLFLCATDRRAATHLFALDRKVRFKPVAEPAPLLHELVELRARGFTEPLPFFPEASYCHATDVSCFDAWKRESLKEHYALAFRGRDTFDDEWAALATQVYGPLLAHTKKEDEE